MVILLFASIIIIIGKWVFLSAVMKTARTVKPYF